jgi:hypothetical protein
MNFLFGGPKQQSNSFGYKLSGTAGLPADLENMKGNIITSNKKYREELTKYREIAKFNQQLSNSYIKNLEAMVDVSRVLNYYVEIFSLFKDEFEKNEALIGTSLKTSDIGYLEKLTRGKIDDLSNKFMTETEKLKKMYSAFGKTEEVSRVSEAQDSLRLAAEGASQTYNVVRRVDQQGGKLPRFRGGSRKPKSNKKK